MTKPLASLHAGLVARAMPRPPQPAMPAPAPSVHRPPVVPLPQPRPSAPAPERGLPWQRPQVIYLRPTRIETMPAPVSETTPMPQPRRRKKTTLRLEPQLYARLRFAREELERSGQSILVEALSEWLATHETTT